MRSRFAICVPAVVASIVMVGTAGAADAVKSGLKAGELVNPFQVDDITGPNKGTSLCYRWRYGSSPVVCVFTRNTSEPLASLVKKIDAKIGENGKLKSFVVLIPAKDGKPDEQLKALAKKCGIENVPLTVGEGPDGPPDYELSKDADVTVLMWVKGEVKVNRAFKGELTPAQVDAVVEDTAQILQK